MKKKAAKFFCENCGAEVPPAAKFCKKCGRFFISVKCPHCGAIGPSAAFANGCPHCGYAGKGNPAEQSTSSVWVKHNLFFSRLQSQHIKKNQPDGSLPGWIYILTLGILAVALVVVTLYVQ